MSIVDARERESSSERMHGNVQLICPHCQGKVKRKRASRHLCVDKGDVIFDGESLIRGENLVRKQ